MSFVHLTTTERSELYKLRVIEQLSVSEIGRRLKRNKSTISRELSRNTDERQIGYMPDTAVALMKARRKQAKVRFESISAETITEVKQRLEQHHSPEQLAGRMEREGLGKISYETIYLMIYANHQEMGICQQYLRQKQKQRRRKGRKQKRGGIPNRIGIEQRPKIADLKTEIGHWESDTVIGCNHTGLVVTHVDKASKYLLAGLAKNKTMDEINRVTFNLFEPIESTSRKTMTFDNGREFCGHEKLSERLKLELSTGQKVAKVERKGFYKDNHITNKTPMKEINLFREMLQQHLRWNAARVAFVSIFLVALIRVRTVNLAEIATGISSEAKVESRYKRLQRFFREFEVDYESIALMVVKVMKIPEPWVISIDRTDWKFGKTVFNVLTLGVVHHGIAFPLVWIMLDKKGNSNTRERCELWNRFLEIFADRQIDFLTADREFVGEEWFDYLLSDPCTRFRIRIRKNTLLDDGQKKLRADICFQDLQVGQSKVLSKPRLVWGHCLDVAAMRLEDGDLLVVATAHNPDKAIADYAKRWAIETLFGCFKSRGFSLESTHLKHSERLSKLIALLTIALCWCFSSGLWQSVLKSLKPKKHGRLPKSIFRLGFDFLRDIILNLHLHANSSAFFNSISFLSCT